MTPAFKCGLKVTMSYELDTAAPTGMTLYLSLIDEHRKSALLLQEGSGITKLNTTTYGIELTVARTSALEPGRYRLEFGLFRPTKRLSIKCGDDDLIVNKAFFKETFAKNVRHSRLAETMNLATEIEDWLPEAKFIRTEEGRHHNCDFRVYETVHGGTSIEVKVKDQKKKLVYTMRIKHKN